MLDQVFHVEGLDASRASDPVCVKHFEDQGGWSSISTVDFFAHFTLFLILLQILVVHFHVEAVTAVQLSTLWVVALDWRVHNF